MNSIYEITISSYHSHENFAWIGKPILDKHNGEREASRNIRLLTNEIMISMLVLTSFSTQLSFMPSSQIPDTPAQYTLKFKVLETADNWILDTVLFPSCNTHEVPGIREKSTKKQTTAA